MSQEMCDSDSHSFAWAMQRKLKRFYDRVKPICVTTLGSTACLEFPVHYLEILNRQNAAAIRRNEWDEKYKDLGDGKPEYDLWLDKYEGSSNKQAIFLSLILAADGETTRCTFA